jgi:hypothetical protein
MLIEPKALGGQTRAECDVCGNNHVKAFVIMAGQIDSLNAINATAPVCGIVVAKLSVTEWKNNGAVPYSYL